jgi:hypothetical protein
VLSGQLAEPPSGPLRVGKQSVAYQRSTTVRKVGFDGQPLLLLGIVEYGKASAVLVVTPGELDVVEYHPDIGRVQLGECREAGKQVGLMDCA